MTPSNCKLYQFVQEQVTIAVEDSRYVVKIPQAKTDYFGIGYDPAIENPEINAYRGSGRQKGLGQGVYRMDALIPAASKGSRSSSDVLRIRGVAGFSLNDDDDDVYDQINSNVAPDCGGYLPEAGNNYEEVDSDDEESNYANKARAKAKKLKSSVDKWLGSTIGSDTLLQRYPTDGKNVLNGFVLSSLEFIKPIVLFAPPPAPKGFTALHIFAEEIILQTGGSIRSKEENNQINSSRGSNQSGVSNKRRNVIGSAVANALILGEATPETLGKTPEITAISISELIHTAMKKVTTKNLEQNIHTVPVPAFISASVAKEESLEKFSNQISTTTTAARTTTTTAAAAVTTTTAAATAVRPMLTSDILLKSTFAGLSKAFQSRFVSSTSVAINDFIVPTAGLTTALEHSEITAAAIAAATTTTATSTSNISSCISNSIHNNSSNTNNQLVSDLNIPKNKNNSSNVVLVPQISKSQSLIYYSSENFPDTIQTGKKNSMTTEAIDSKIDRDIVKDKDKDSKNILLLDKNSLKGKSSRVSRVWYPVPLLSRRFHIKMDGDNHGTKGGRQLQQQQQQQGSHTVDYQLDSMFASMRETNTNSNIITSINDNSNYPDSMPVRLFSAQSLDIERDDILTMTEVKEEALPIIVKKPPMSLFKSIFENSDSSDDDDDDDDEKEEEEEEQREEKHRADDKEFIKEKDKVIEEKKIIFNTKINADKVREEEIRTTATMLVNKSIALGKLSKSKNINEITGSTNVHSSHFLDGDALNKNMKKENSTSFSSTIADDYHKNSVKYKNNNGYDEDNNDNKSMSKKNDKNYNDNNSDNNNNIEENMTTSVLSDIVNEVEEERERVVFRKPIVKAKLKTFSNKLKPKRSFAVMSYNDEEEDDEKKGDGKGDGKDRREIERNGVEDEEIDLQLELNTSSKENLIKKKNENKNENKNKNKNTCKNENGDRNKVENENEDENKKECVGISSISKEDNEIFKLQEKRKSSDSIADDELPNIVAKKDFLFDMSHQKTNILLVPSSSSVSSSKSSSSVLSSLSSSLSSSSSSSSSTGKVKFISIDAAIDVGKEINILNWRDDEEKDKGKGKGNEKKEEKDVEKNVDVIKKIINVDYNINENKIIETDESRIVSDWYARNEMKKKEREEIVRKLKDEEDMKIMEFRNEKEMMNMESNDKEEKDKYKKGKKRKHSHHNEERESQREKVREKKKEKKLHKLVKSKKSEKSKKSKKNSHNHNHNHNHDHDYGDQRVQENNDSTNSSSSDSD